LRSEAAGRYGAIISFVDGRKEPLPFDHVIVSETGRMRPRKVNVEGETYECARRYMTHLERQDFEEQEYLAQRAEAAGLSPEQFRERFGYLVGLGERPQGRLLAEPVLEPGEDCHRWRFA
jgi:6-phosphofructokinase 1